MGVLVRNRVGDLRAGVRVTTADMQALGNLARTRIIRRTLQGRDGDNKAFAPYSRGYTQARLKEGVAVPNVTLELSGQMLDSIKVIAGPKEVRLTF